MAIPGPAMLDTGGKGGTGSGCWPGSSYGRPEERGWDLGWDLGWDMVGFIPRAQA